MLCVHLQSFIGTVDTVSHVVRALGTKGVVMASNPFVEALHIRVHSMVHWEAVDVPDVVA